MSLAKYYKRLGLLPGADKTAIRKAYRKLAMRYHPDKNPSISAQAKFIAITEAYEILTGKKPAPVERARRTHNPARQRKKPTTTQTVRNTKSHEERIREAKERQEKQSKKEFEENERYFQALTSGWRWKIMKWSAVLGVILSVALIAERFLPHHFVPDQITQYSLAPGVSSGDENVSYIETAGDNSFWISHIHYDLFGRHTKVLVKTSWFFHQPIEIVSFGKVDYRSYCIHFSFYRNFIVLILLFLLPSLVLIMKNKTITFTIIHQTSFYGVNALMLYFLFANDHWAHLLTLGFL